MKEFLSEDATKPWQLSRDSPRVVDVSANSLLSSTPQPKGERAYIYIVGGRNSSKVDTTVAERFNCATAEWEPLPPMLTARSLCSAATIDGQLYVVGGCRTGRPLATCERYNPWKNQWEALPRMVTVRHACTAAAVNGMLYVANRRVGNLQSPATCERFDPANGKWQVIPLTSTPYVSCTLAAVGGQLYIVLERDGTHAIERLEYGSSCWEPLPPKPATNEYTFWVAAGAGNSFKNP